MPQQLQEFDPNEFAPKKKKDKPPAGMQRNPYGELLSTMYGAEDSLLPPIRGVTRPALPSSEGTDWQGWDDMKWLYENVARPSSSVVGAASDWATGKVLGAIAKPIIGKAADLYKKFKGAELPPIRNVEAPIADLPPIKPSSYDIDHARWNELTDKATAGTINRNELIEAQQLNGPIRESNFNRESYDKINPKPNSSFQDATPISDASGRSVAPPQSELPVRPTGPWDQNLAEPMPVKPDQPLAIPNRAPQFPKAPAVPTEKPFDPSTLGFEGAAKQFDEAEFVNPTTGEIIPESLAKQGDVPLQATPEIPEVPITGRSATKRMGSPDLGLTGASPELPVRQPQPETLNTNALSKPAMLPDEAMSIEQPPLMDILPPGPPKPPMPPRSNNPNRPNQPNPRMPLVPQPPPPSGPIRTALSAHKAFLTSGDLSAPGRQGKAFILNKAWWTSLDDMVKSWGSKNAFDAVNDAIQNDPSGFFKRTTLPNGRQVQSWAEQMGLELPKHEEMFNSTIGKKIAENIPPFVERSSRAHTAFLNTLRKDQFKSMIKASQDAGIDPIVRQDIARAYAKFINDATGRGSLNFGSWKLERNMQVLNDVFFAPKNMSGQIRTWNNVLNPAKYYNYDPVLRKQALKSLFAIAGMGLGVGELARQAGAQVSNDPTSADFRKVKIGDTRIDMFGGYQQFPVAAMKLLSGSSTSTVSGKTTNLNAGRYGQQTRASVAEKFFINRLSPLASFVYAWMNNSEFDGKSFEVKRAIFERTFPIAAKDIYELAQEDPTLAAIMAPATLTGLAGTQHYTGR